MPGSKRNKICIASISGAHGVRGDLKIRVYLNNPSDIEQYTPIFFEDGSEFPLHKVIRSLPSSVIASAKTVKDRDEALRLRGEKLYVMREQLPELESDTYYHTDLIGLPVENDKGTVVGMVKYIHDYGAGPILEVFDPSTYKSVLVPFRNESVPIVDLARVVIREQYLTDLYEE
jgi:16S rRNA processing protein RimM